MIKYDFVGDIFLLKIWYNSDFAPVAWGILEDYFTVSLQSPN